MAKRRPPNLKRRRYIREPKKRFVLYCEGKKTEPAYFLALRKAYANALVEVSAIPAVGVPYTIAQEATAEAKKLGIAKRSRRHRDSFEENDEVWAIFDRDEHPRYDEAISLCDGCGVRVARSNPCFEIWLILHFSPYERPDERHTVQGRLRDYCAEYDPRRGKSPDCSALICKVLEAEERAATQLKNREREGSPFGRPSTTVGMLTQAIREASLNIK